MEGNRQVRVMVVDDSPTAREYLSAILASDPEITIAGNCRHGWEAVEKVAVFKPDVITMDINMPHLDGFEATARIMETCPVPIIIVTGHWNTEAHETVFRSIQAGALTVVQRPKGFGSPDADRTIRELIDTVKLMSSVKVVTRRSKSRQLAKPGKTWQPDSPVEIPDVKSAWHARAVAIGVSTGGPQVLNTILGGLPAGLPVPILIVQHISQGFIQGMANWLKSGSAMEIVVPLGGEIAMPGTVYLAPDDTHMGITPDNHIILSRERPHCRHRPSVSYLFHSAAESLGPDVLAILLTGMGEDGALELKRLRDLGAVTIAQDMESSVIHGMPGVAIELGAADHVMNPEQIIQFILTEFSRKKYSIDTN